MPASPCSVKTRKTKTQSHLSGEKPRKQGCEIRSTKRNLPSQVTNLPECNLTGSRTSRRSSFRGWPCWGGRPRTWWRPSWATGCEAYLYENVYITKFNLIYKISLSFITVVVEGEFVEHPAAGLLADVLVHRLPPQLVQAHRVRERLRRRLRWRETEMEYLFKVSDKDLKRSYDPVTFWSIILDPILLTRSAPSSIQMDLIIWIVNTGGEQILVQEVGEL